ncbi:MAG: DUF4832 domain-containing protein [Planctomycetota bacterium]
MNRLLEFNKRIGYRFFIHNLLLPLESKPGGRIEVKVTVDNKGIAPIYHPYKFAFRFVQGGRTAVVPFNVDIRTWMPDYSYFTEAITVPRTLKRGVAELACGIVDDRGKPVVRFAQKPVTADGWHPMTRMDIL